MFWLQSQKIVQIKISDMVKYVPLILLFLFAILSCSSYKGVHKGTNLSRNDIFIIGAECIFKEGLGMDTKVGSVQCGEIVFDYDFGKYSFSGPVTPEEGFMRAFNANYYARFFEIIHIEAKLNRLFRDSVALVIVRDKSKTDNLLFECMACDKVAKVKFRGRSYLYPYVSQNQDTHSSAYQISTDTMSGFIRKIFISKVDSLPSGLYLRQNINERTGNKLSLITKSRVDSKALTDIFKSIVLK